MAGLEAVGNPKQPVIKNIFLMLCSILYGSGICSFVYLFFVVILLFFVYFLFGFLFV